MKYASQDLRDEHEGILAGLEVLEEMAARIKAGQKTDPADLAEMIRFFRTFADKCHHGKEEGLFFPALERAGILNQNGPIGQMLSEHVQGRNHLSKMADAIKDGTVDGAKFAAAAESYAKLLRAHIQKENTVLFPLGDRLLPRDVQTSLLEGFENHEETVMGVDVHEQLHELLHDFQHKYLPEQY